MREIEYRRDRLAREKEEAAAKLDAMIAQGVADRSFLGVDPTPVVEAFVKAYPKRRRARKGGAK